MFRNVIAFRLGGKWKSRADAWTSEVSNRGVDKKRATDLPLCYTVEHKSADSDQSSELDAYAEWHQPGIARGRFVVAPMKAFRRRRRSSRRKSVTRRGLPGPSACCGDGE